MGIPMKLNYERQPRELRESTLSGERRLSAMLVTIRFSDFEPNLTLDLVPR